MKINIRLSISEDKLGSAQVQYLEMVDLEHVTEDMIINHIIPHMVRSLLPVITKVNPWPPRPSIQSRSDSEAWARFLKNQGQQIQGGIGPCP
jgi:hypothetical protein